MSRIKNYQVALKPQDVVLLLKIALNRRAKFGYATVARALFVSPSEVHAGLQRCRLARLVAIPQPGDLALNHDALKEFVLVGAR